MDLATALQQLGTAGAIIFAVVYLQRSTASNLQALLGLVLPALDVKADLAAINARLGAIDERLATLESRRDSAAE